MTHTYVRLEISPAAWAEIVQKLRDAFYNHAFHDDVIDMHGIGLAKAASAGVDPRAADIVGGFPVVSENCAGCGKPLLIENAWMTDGCPCNTPLGVNSMNETRWRLLMQLQQRQARENDSLAKFKAYVHRRLDEAGVPTDPESPHKAVGCRIGGRLDIVLAHADLVAKLPKTADGAPIVPGMTVYLECPDPEWWRVEPGTVISGEVKDITRGNSFPGDYRGDFTLGLVGDVACGNGDVYRSQAAAQVAADAAHRFVEELTKPEVQNPGSE